jgi:superfamily II DNA or RNA helicase
MHLEPGNFGNGPLKEALADVEDGERIIEAAGRGDTRSLDESANELRRITGQVKAHAIIEAVKEEFECGLEKIVLMAWHKNTIETLFQGLQEFNPVVLDGSTPAMKRQGRVDAFANGRSRVFIGQIVAAGEALDLSSADEMIFVEASWLPKDMAQAAMRIVNITKRRQPRVRFAVLTGSIDEALTMVLARLVDSIKTLTENIQ